jgi:methylmalonyl-CoA mutase C-terminal domain/subunit
MARRTKILLAKVGLDGHDRGVKVVAQALRSAGMEVVYLGVHQTSAAIVETAIQEDVDVVGLSSLAGGHLVYAEQVLSLLRERGADRVPVVLGGTLPFEDIPRLEAMGIRAVFPPGTLATDLVGKIEELARIAQEEGELP